MFGLPGRGAPPALPHPAAVEHAVVELGELRPTVLRAGRMLVETVVVPTALLTIFLHTTGLLAGLASAIGWCLLTVALRWIFGRQVPASLLLGSCVVVGRCTVALATSSAFVYLLQPALGSALMSALFLGSALLGRPVTLRLARDFVSLPQHILDRRDVRRMFTQVAVLWGLSRLADAAMSLTSLQHGLDAGLLSRGVLSPSLTVLAVAACVVWGTRSLRRNGISVRLTRSTAPG